MTKTKKEKINSTITQAPKKSTFFTRKSDMRRQTTKLLTFSKIYSQSKLWHKIVISFSMGLIMALISVLFAESTGLYVGGLSSFFQGTARLTRSWLLAANMAGKNNLSHGTINLIYTLMFWGQYLAVNVGLFFLAWKKIGHEFAILSLVYIVALQGLGFAFDQIPALQNINLFGETATINEVLKNAEVKSIVFYPNLFPKLNLDGAFDWTVMLTRSQASPIVVQTITNANITRSICLILYASIYAILHAICASILLIIGSSTAGSDILSIYFSYKKNKSVGSTMLIINGIGLVLGVTIGTYISGIVVGSYSTIPGISASSFAGIQYLFSANLIGSIVWVVLFTTCVNKFFPWKKMVKCEVITSKFDEIKKHLFEIGYQHPATVVDAKGAYSGKPVQVAFFICQVVEIHKLVSHIREIDQCCMISAQYIDDMDGNIAILRHTN